MKRRGPKTAAWENVRRKLKVAFERAGITRCETCGGTFALSFAHDRKRREITTDEQLYTVALCAQHHDMIEKWPHAEMAIFVRNIIESRETPVRI